MKLFIVLLLLLTFLLTIHAHHYEPSKNSDSDDDNDVDQYEVGRGRNRSEDGDDYTEENERGRSQNEDEDGYRAHSVEEDDRGNSQSESGDEYRDHSMKEDDGGRSQSEDEDGYINRSVEQSQDDDYRDRSVEHSQDDYDDGSEKEERSHSSDYDDDSWMSESSSSVKEIVPEKPRQNHVEPKPRKDHQDRSYLKDILPEQTLNYREQMDMLEITGLSDSSILYGPGAPNLEDLRREADNKEAARNFFNTSRVFDGFGPDDRLLESFGVSGPVVKGPGSSSGRWPALQLGEGPPMNWGTFDGQTLVSTGLMNTYCSANSYPVGIGETLVFQVRATFQNDALGGVTSPFGIDEDPFYGAGIIGAVEPDSGLELAIILTNSRVFVKYCRRSYARDDDSELNQFTPFTYLIPVAYRSKYAYNTYAIKFTSGERLVLFQMDGKTLLALEELGKPIARKFQVSPDDYKPSDWMSYFPTSVRFILGSNYAGEEAGVNTACQQALYEPGKVSLQKAWLTDCRYAPWQDPGTYQVQLSMAIDSAKIFLIMHDGEE